MKGMGQSAQTSAMAGMADDGMADDMPCHPAKYPSDNACPFMAACLSLCFQGISPELSLSPLL
jgi:hypothetical protein